MKVGNVSFKNLGHDDQLAANVSELRTSIADIMGGAKKAQFSKYVTKYLVSELKAANLLGKTLSKESILAMRECRDPAVIKKSFRQLAGEVVSELVNMDNISSTYQLNIEKIAAKVEGEREITSADLENSEGIPSLVEDEEESYEEDFDEISKLAKEVCQGLGHLIREDGRLITALHAEEEQIADKALVSVLESLQPRWFSSPTVSNEKLQKKVDTEKVAANPHKDAIRQLTVRRAVALHLLDGFTPLSVGHTVFAQTVGEIKGLDERTAGLDIVETLYGKGCTLDRLLGDKELNVNWEFIKIPAPSRNSCSMLLDVAEKVNPVQLIRSEVVVPDLSVSTMLGVRVPQASASAAGVGIFRDAAPAPTSYAGAAATDGEEAGVQLA